MARVLIIGGFLAVVFWVFSIVDCAAQPATRHRGVSKFTWVLIVLLLPVIGGILWFTLGRLRPGAADAGYVVPPDDDPQVLRRMRNAEQDARIRELEAELARLDDDSDGADPRS
ncbi:PLD nuclease N-terminal domain-containing protein [Microbacterium sp. ARD32]|uniref:PLD nuclease N-terminal domain-containing protein n=1 Tax=Microbacterium sp. ARD32 TaxID=2962577 RepID=UPI002881D1F4|nr:PLD nuclease N-terminal domain-containing protein [Microbacterium sp. ARD32]MDT0158345.1 PLD nuclease N-terminal domain-containing protein [Microbacterium sp. ARD32]